MQPLRGFFERRGAKPAAHGSACLVARHQAGVGEHSDVLHDVGQRHGERHCKLADGQGRRFRQPQQNRAPGRIGEGRERSIELCRLIANHMVKYYGAASGVKRQVARDRRERPVALALPPAGADTRCLLWKVTLRA